MKEYENLKNAREIEKNELSFSKPTDVFIYTSFAIKQPHNIVAKQIHFAEDITQTINYIRHIFLYDILNDIVDDLEYDLNNASKEKQKDIISIMNYWFKFGQISKQKNEKDFLELWKEFNFRDNTDYEIRILNGANELRDFLIEQYESESDFNKYKLECICSNEVFAGELLEEFIQNLFNT